MKKITNKKKTFGVPAYIPNEADGFRKASEEQTRIAQRSVVGKGSGRRIENTQLVRDNWPFPSKYE
jgi:hypothetical protein